ncbi:LacI family transcriptional regulator [Haloactinopolyspora alba]|uniref:LacI family transcriptional regulator n=1 Tax=Haloactinopolyspora alba TaxID=648780 RepID=A0A2P8DRF1_9ACTN|nr:LacI family DNA-binding transcriptional regulator [Haloactinopolyspora alba]PSK99789.1 LacI family transcriptional regulator [Haloactinopolyspora alba]
MEKRITLADVAAHAGVSRAAASLVLRGTGRISDQTRDRVLESMRELGYVYHRGAASLRHHRTQTVGLLLPDLSNPFNAEFTNGLESVLTEAGVVTLMVNTFERPQRQARLLEALLERQVDSVVVVPAYGTEELPLQRMQATGVACVLAVRDLGVPDVPFVGVDNIRGGQIAGQHLLDHGCRRLAFLGGLPNLGPRQDRFDGLRRAVASSEEAHLVADVPGPMTALSGQELAEHLLSVEPFPDGVLCHHDQTAFGLMRALRKTGHDVSHGGIRVIGFDDVAEAALWEPPLTSVSASGTQLGRNVADVLLKGTDDPKGPGSRQLLGPSLVVRESCGTHRDE